MRITACLVMVALLVAAPAPAHAGPDERPVTASPAASASVSESAAGAAPPGEQGRWYGWELILSDALFLMLAADGNNANPESGLGSAGLPIGLAGLALVPPALHVVHGNPRRAAFGFLVRSVAVGLWGVAVLSDKDSGSCNGQDSCAGISSGDVALVGMAVAAALGAGIYVFIDDFWYSRTPAAPAARPLLTMAPSLSLRSDGGVVGLAGRF
jgi:hypothetical protein